ncbi:MAG: hypothetical protein ACXVNM_01565 [Bacteroidia bacterium]
MEPLRIQLEKLLDPQGQNTAHVIEAAKEGIKEGRIVIIERKFDNLEELEAFLDTI